MMYVYAIVDRPESPISKMDGLDDAPVHLLGYRDIGAVVSLSSTAKVPPTQVNLWRHEAVMDALMPDRSVLPVRFGTVLADEKSIQGALGAHYDDFVANLSRVRGRVELALKVLWDGDGAGMRAREAAESAIKPAADASPGRMYMAARLKEYRERQERRDYAEACAGVLHSALADLATQSRIQLLPTRRVLIAAAYLVGRRKVADFRRRMEDLRVSHPALRFVCTGPWPPFSFVGVEECRNGHRIVKSDVSAG